MIASRIPDPIQYFHRILLSIRILWAAIIEKALLVDYFGLETFIVVGLIGLLPKRYKPAVVYLGRVPNPKTRLPEFMSNKIIKFFDQGVTLYAAYANDAKTNFTKYWRIKEDKIRVSYYYMDTLEDEVNIHSKVDEKLIFSGGIANRDFKPIIQVARKMPYFRFIIGTINLGENDDIPSNVKVCWPSKKDYRQLVHDAATVILPVDTNSTIVVGLMGLLEAMWLRTPVIISDAIGVRDYVQDDNTGIIVDGSTEGYLEAIQWVLDPKNAFEVKTMCDRAYDVVTTQFTLGKYVERLIAIMDEAMEIAGV
jgi:glycosyltransferase involved in cell wall biosynthesis